MSKAHLAINELSCKLQARLMLTNRSTTIITPSQEEWIGLNLLERDDELPKEKKDGKG